MTKGITLAAATAFLMVGCGLGPEETAVAPTEAAPTEAELAAAEVVAEARRRAAAAEAALAEAERRAAVAEVDEQTAAASPEFDLEDDTEWTIWAKISAADPHGIAIDKVEDGDELTIETLSGVGYFTGKSGWWQVLSAIYKVSGAAVPTGSTAATVITALRDETLPGDGEGDDISNSSKPRDAYGRQLDGGNGQFGEEEGGIVVCMPNAGGPMYAHSANHFTRTRRDDSDDGAEAQAVGEQTREGRSDRRGMKNNSEMPGKCFPATRDERVHTIRGNGVLHIYAFDHNYRDNAGSYEIKFRIVRPRPGA